MVFHVVAPKCEHHCQRFPEAINFYNSQRFWFILICDEYRGKVPPPLVSPMGPYFGKTVQQTNTVLIPFKLCCEIHMMFLCEIAQWITIVSDDIRHQHQEGCYLGTIHSLLPEPVLMSLTKTVTKFFPSTTFFPWREHDDEELKIDLGFIFVDETWRDNKLRLYWLAELSNSNGIKRLFASWR